MAKIIYITGGERSGKSSFAQTSALHLCDNPVYMATARHWDNDFEKRIQRHIQDRDERWTTIEEETFISQHDLTDKVVVLDCITLWLTNIYTDKEYNTESVLDFAKNELSSTFKQDCTLFIISNEIGMGVHASSQIGRKFVEIQGWVNQYIAGKSNEAYFMISGIPLKIK